MPTAPISMRALMDDPLYRAYMKRVPPIPVNLRTGQPWQVWVNLGEGRWGTTLRATYADAWGVFLRHYRSEEQRDVTVVSRRVFFAPPGEWYKVKVRLEKPRVSVATGAVTTHRIEQRWRQTFFWDATDLHWCGRCRRPSYWMPLFADHHALRKMPAVSQEDNYRCLICGIRWITQPHISQMVHIERQPV
jgi:hypothetical protein